MIKDILSIRAVEVRPEQTFSLTCDYVTYQQNYMHGVTVKCYMIIQSWLSQCEDFGFSMDGPVPDIQ